LLSSLTRGLPTGPTVVLCISAIVFLSMLFAPNRGILWEQIRRRRNRTQLRSMAVLETLYQLGAQHAEPTHPHSLNAIRATVPGRGVLHTLAVLESEGLVQRTGEKEWALTGQGVTQIERKLRRGDESKPPEAEETSVRSVTVRKQVTG
jgi:manganese/zinc/iron transport system permease protein